MRVRRVRSNAPGARGAGCAVPHLMADAVPRPRGAGAEEQDVPQDGRGGGRRSRPARALTRPRAHPWLQIWTAGIRAASTAHGTAAGGSAARVYFLFFLDGERAWSVLHQKYERVRTGAPLQVCRRRGMQLKRRVSKVRKVSAAAKAFVSAMLSRSGAVEPEQLLAAAPGPVGDDDGGDRNGGDVGWGGLKAGERTSDPSSETAVTAFDGDNEVHVLDGGAEQAAPAAAPAHAMLITSHSRLLLAAVGARQDGAAVSPDQAGTCSRERGHAPDVQRAGGYNAAGVLPDPQAANSRAAQLDHTLHSRICAMPPEATNAALPALVAALVRTHEQLAVDAEVLRVQALRAKAELASILQQLGGDPDAPGFVKLPVGGSRPRSG